MKSVMVTLAGRVMWTVLMVNEDLECCVVGGGETEELATQDALDKIEAGDTFMPEKRYD